MKRTTMAARFCELANKVLANEADPEERAELEVLLAANPKLKSEFEQLEAAARAARQLLPLLAGLVPPDAAVPEPPLEKLKAEIAAVFAEPRGGAGEVRELLGKLERWAIDQIGPAREHAMELLTILRRSLDPAHAVSTEAAAALREEWPSGSGALGTPQASTTQPGKMGLKKAGRPIEERLRLLEERLEQAEQVARECREEVRSLLELIERERAGRNRR